MRGGLLAALALFLGVICVLAGIFWWNGREEATLEQDREYFLLVRDCTGETAAAVAGQVYFSGGAGYLLGNEVVIACYFSERDAAFVQSGMAERGVETRLRRIAPSVCILHGDAAGEAARIRSNAETADSCARILFDAANGLERTDLSQETARAAVEGVVSSLAGLRKGNAGKVYGEWNARLLSAGRRGREIASGILFAKDLRYLQVDLCLAVSSLSEYFA